MKGTLYSVAVTRWMTEHEQDHLRPADPYLSQGAAEPVPAGQEQAVHRSQSEAQHLAIHARDVASIRGAGRKVGPWGVM